MITLKELSTSMIAYPTGTNKAVAEKFESRSDVCIHEALAHLNTHGSEAFDTENIEDICGYDFRIPVKGFAFTHILAEWQEETEDFYLTLVYMEGHMERHITLEDYKWQIAVQNLNLRIFA